MNPFLANSFKLKIEKNMGLHEMQKALPGMKETISPDSNVEVFKCLHLYSLL
jgi:hypothetical protein